MNEESAPAAESLDSDLPAIEQDDELSSSQFGRLTINQASHVASLAVDESAFQNVSLTVASAQDSPSSSKTTDPNALSSQSGAAAASLASTLERSDGQDDDVREEDFELSHGSLDLRRRERTSSIDRFRDWSVSTYKVTRQFLSERFGRGSRTVDTHMEFQVQSLRDIQHKYSDIIRVARQLSAQLFAVFQTHRVLGDTFGELSAKHTDLHDEFKYNSDTQRLLYKNGETLLSAINFFIANLTTLCTKTMEDTLATVKKYEAARVEYDAYRTDLEETEKVAVTTDAQKAKLEMTKQEFTKHRHHFDTLRHDVFVKLRLLDENRVCV